MTHEYETYATRPHWKDWAWLVAVVLVALITLAFIFGCAKAPEPPQATVQAIAVTPANVTVSVAMPDPVLIAAHEDVVRPITTGPAKSTGHDLQLAAKKPVIACISASKVYPEVKVAYDCRRKGVANGKLANLLRDKVGLKNQGVAAAGYNSAPKPSAKPRLKLN